MSAGREKASQDKGLVCLGQPAQPGARRRAEERFLNGAVRRHSCWEIFLLPSFSASRPPTHLVLDIKNSPRARLK